MCRKGKTMTYNWAANLDMLAQNGVLDYDAPSYITGQKPRYVGSPDIIPSPYGGAVPVPQTPIYMGTRVGENFFTKNPIKKI